MTTETDFIRYVRGDFVKPDRVTPTSQYNVTGVQPERKPTKLLTGDSRTSFVINALRVAAVQYATDAHTAMQIPTMSSPMVKAGAERLRDTFLEQADQANAIAADMEATW